ncbi:hypothetical protein M758_9G076300 [Ceratodon purpureus]|nr:hypothetical protein M758_9G076300 [Ceratodon purpureus]
MADVVDGAGDAPAVEQESRSFELPTEEAPADPVEAPAPPPAEDAGSSSSSDDEDEKKRTILPSTDELPPASELPAKAQGKWNQLLSKIHPVVKKHAETVANHPYVTATASTLRQRAGQAQEQMQPIVNHPYVQKGTGAIKAGGTKTMETGKKVATDKRVIQFLIATVGLVALGLIIRVLLQKYPEFGGDLKMKFMKKKEEL